ncbi:CKLF-like MARVEL transmembrane domain-containing protein 4 [Clytia hemisphaerica]|uniref:MARVEL domain-containing protein n=1 Tax=Clytia hemisphaerica TaxID=252671 RepID=A0A7M6DPW6_9CNID
MATQTTIIIQQHGNPYTEQPNPPPQHASIDPIQPTFNDSTPAQPVDYTAPQQPYYVDIPKDYTKTGAPSEQSPPAYNANSGYTGSAGGQRNFEFLKTVAGILNIIALVLLFTAWMAMAAWRGHIGSTFYLLHVDGSSFFFFTILLPFFVKVGYLLLVVLGLIKYRYIDRLDWNFTVMVNDGLSGFFMLVSSCIVARRVEEHLCLNHNCTIIQTAAAFGFLSSFMFAGIVAYYFKRWKQGPPVHQ